MPILNVILGTYFNVLEDENLPNQRKYKVCNLYLRCARDLFIKQRCLKARVYDYLDWIERKV